MDITPIEAELSAKVFHNPNIMDIILNNMEGGLMQNLYLRLVSKIFNAACVDIIVKNHVTIKVEYRGEPQEDSYEELRIERTEEQRLADIEEEQKDKLKYAKMNLYVNNQSVNILKIDGYFKLLKRFNLWLENIILVNLSKLRFRPREILHHAIIKNHVALKTKPLNSFIGASDICYGCKHCERIAMRSREYGPIHDYLLQDVICSKHFTKLVISDRLLYQHCNQSVLYTKDKFFQESLYKDLGRRSISCDTLILQVFEQISENNQDENPDESGNIFKHHPIPREALEWLIRKWKVKFMKFEIGRTNWLNDYMSDFIDEDWTQCGYLTKLILNNSVASKKYNKKLEPALEQVHLDFAEASFLSVSVSEHRPAWKCILGNAQNIFSTNHFKISLSPMSHHTPELIREVLECVLKMVSKKHEKKFMIDVRYNMKLEEFSVCDDISSIWQSIQTSSYSYKFTKSTLNEQCKKRYSNEMNPYNNGERIVKKFKLENIRNHWTINFEFWIIN